MFSRNKEIKKHNLRLARLLVYSKVDQIKFELYIVRKAFEQYTFCYHIFLAIVFLCNKVKRKKKQNTRPFLTGFMTAAHDFIMRKCVKS